MTTSGEADVRQKLAALQLAFKESLPGKIAQMMALRDRFADGEHDGEIEAFHRMVHSLAGSGGTFGAVALSKVARELEQSLNPLLTKSDNLGLTLSKILPKIDKYLLRLAKTADTWQPSNIPYIKPVESKPLRLNNLVFLVEDDQLLAKNIITKLEKEKYEIKYFSQLDDFETAVMKDIPAAIIMDMVFDEGEFAGAAVIQNIKKTLEYCPPVIFISVRGDIEARLAAARVGAARYFFKPLDMLKLTQTLNGLTEQTIDSPYRILLVDDDESLLEYYSAVLINAGMEVKTLMNPLLGLTVLEEFKPDIMVVDVYMPECSGPELAQVIRQDDTWSQMPIMFLSTESDINRQLEALNLGGDDFLVKPVQAGHIISAVTARVKRARWTTRLNNELKSALRESQFLLTTMDHHDIVSTADVAGRITAVNDKFCEVSGYSREELLGENHNLLKSGLHPDEFYDAIWETISQGKIWHGEICNRNKEGLEYWVDSTIVPFLDDNGVPYKYVSARTDITKLRQGEERLSRSQEFANIGTWDWNINNGELYWSDRIWPLFGYDKRVTETTFDNFLDALHPQDKDRVVNAINNCIDLSSKFNIEHRIIWPDGSVHWLQQSGDVVRDASGKALHMLGVVQDINSRQQASLALIERERQLQEAQSMAHMGNWQANLITGELEWSDEIYRIFGYEPHSIEPTIEVFRAALHADDANTVTESEQQATITGVHDVVHRIVRPDGVIRHVHELAKAELDAEGNVIRFSGTVQDITESVEVHQALIQAREEAEEANRAKSQFLSSMSHELRTPLNAIIGFGQLMEMDVEQSLSESQKENVEEILKGGQHLLQLINEVLDLAKIEAGRIDLSMEKVVLAEVVLDAMHLINPLAQNRGIKITLMRNNTEIALDELSEQESLVWADHTRLKQVILNLLSNAVKYNKEKGKIILTCNETDDNRVRISITDTGPGLTREQQQVMFTAFNRLGAEGTDIEGTGIGLVITKNIVELMGGQIGIASEAGVGSTFWIELPGVNADWARDTVKGKRDSAGLSEAHKLEHEHTVLYIEDNPANLRLVSQLLGRLPYIRLWSAHEPLLGLELATSYQPDLILLDINLPGMNGFEVLKHLRQRESTRDIPVIAISANARAKDIQRGKKVGFDDYITKPIDVKELLKIVEERLLKS